MRWFGHAVRLPAAAPASLALNESLNTTTKKPHGSQKTTWIKQVAKDLTKLYLIIEQALELENNGGHSATNKWPTSASQSLSRRIASK